MKMILDLDTGVDDALALAYVLASPEVELIGITGTYGNVTVETGVQNDLDLLKLFGREDVPVYAGITHPSAVEDFELLEGSVIYHGANGTGNVAIPAKSQRTVEELGAVDFIIESVRTYGKDLVVVPTGASTNIAAALEKAPDIVDKIKIVMMGGALTQPGNMNPFAEANMLQDPEASNALIHSGADITMVGLDVTLQAYTTKAYLESLAATGTPAGEFYADMSLFYISVEEDCDPDSTIPDICVLHDPLAAAVAMDETLVQTIEVPMQVELDGPQRGRTIGDPIGLFGNGPKVKVAVAVDAERFVKSFEERLLSIVTQ